MQKNDVRDTYRSIPRLYVPEWQTNQIRVTNFDLVDHMSWMLKRDGRFNEILAVERKEIEHLKHNQHSLRNLLHTPFLMVAPTLQSVEDWRCFIDGTATTVAVDQLRKTVPELDALSLYAIDQHNRMFVDLVKNVLGSSVLAAPLLGITCELAEYLASVPMYKLRLALGEMKSLPLFRWRFNSPTFWYEFTANTFTDEMIAHQLMATSPIKTFDLPRNANWADLRLPREKNEMYAHAMMAYGCRASTASTLFRLNPSAMRQRYAEMHGVSSPCGNQPTSLAWFVESPENRVHATALTWLYRSALARGANPPEAMIATLDIYALLFSGRQLISADRACNLTRSMAADTRLTISGCRSCRTHYVISNNESRIEMHNTFDCPACNRQLAQKKRIRRVGAKDAS